MNGRPLLSHEGSPVWPHKPAVAVVGMGYGDEGKGTIVDWICRDIKNPVVVRFNGGPQAAHNVVLSINRKHHTFAQFGSGTLAGAKTVLGPEVLVNPLHLLAEEQHLYELGVPSPLNMLSIDGWCLLITPYHKALNKIREESRGAERHGSCGQGVGEAVHQGLKRPELTIRASDALASRSYLEALTYNVRAALWEEAGTIAPKSPWISVFEDDNVARSFVEACIAIRQCVRPADEEISKKDISVVFEGAQGVLLDEDYGWHPYTTWSKTTFANVERMIPRDAYKRVGLLRTYSTRHGHGPFVPGEALPHHTLSVTYGDEVHNAKNDWQGEWRTGPFDFVASKYAIEAAGGVDGLVVTHTDRVRSEWPFITSYQKDLGRIVQLKPNHEVQGEARLVAQERWTNELFKMLPEVGLYSDPSAQSQPLTGTPKFVRYIGEKLNEHVTGVSYGVTADYKRWLGSNEGGWWMDE